MRPCELMIWSYGDVCSLGIWVHCGTQMFTVRRQPLRYSWGVQPVIFLKTVLKQLSAQKPSIDAMSPAVMSVDSSSSFAISIRLSCMYSLTLFPVSCFIMSLRYSADIFSSGAIRHAVSMLCVAALPERRKPSIMPSTVFIAAVLASWRVINWRV